jgi:protein TonB
MSYGAHPDPRQRTLAIGATVALTLLVGFALFGHRWSAAVQDVADRISAIALEAPPPPSAPPAERPAAPEPEGAASPANTRNDPTQVVAPRPTVVIREMPARAAPVEGTGNATDSGAAPTPGPGTGAGGEGSGRGAGAGGNGTGGGGGAVRAQHRRGGIGYRDWPDGVPRADAPVRVEVRYWVEVNGRCTACEIQRSSGIAALDARTCQLVMQRFRYEPARNAAGEAIRSEVAWRQDWWNEAR